MTDTEIVDRFLAGDPLGDIAWEILEPKDWPSGADISKAFSRVDGVIRTRLRTLTDELRVVYEGTVDLRERQGRDAMLRVQGREGG